jgi:hypothetical protein
MSRKPDRKSATLPAIEAKKQQLEAKQAELKAKLNKTRQFLEKAPALKEEVQRKEQRAIFDRFNRPAKLEGPVNFRLDYEGPKNPKPPRPLRGERARIPWFTLLLFVIFAVVTYYSWKSLSPG